MNQTFDEWWKKVTSTKVSLYGEANAKKAWDYQEGRIYEMQERIDRLEALLKPCLAAALKGDE
jgi:hypothetical protein